VKLLHAPSERLPHSRALASIRGWTEWTRLGYAQAGSENSEISCRMDPGLARIFPKAARWPQPASGWQALPFARKKKRDKLPFLI
jgi:hypothetical protein